MKRILSPTWGGVTLLGGLIFLSGCSRPVGTIEGKVTSGNKVLKGGTVSFVSTEGRQSFSCEIKEDGTYVMNNIKGGSYKVCVDTSYLLPAKQSGPGYGGKGVAPKTSGPPKGKGGPPPDAQVPEGYKPSSPSDDQNAANLKKYVKISEKYKDPDQTDLTYTAVGGSQTFNIELK